MLFLSRLFGGLKQGLAAGRWEPRGVPTIYRLLEGLAADPEVELLTVFADKERDARFGRCVRRTVDPIGETLILPWRAVGGDALHRVSLAVTEFEHTARMLAEAARFRPDVVYATYANIHAAAALARAGHKGVVLRLMGVVPHHRRIAEGRSPVFRWQLRAPFAGVISTEDGSDPGLILPRILHPHVPLSVRLNGCDARPLSAGEIAAVRADLGLGARPVVCFLGRLEMQKGALTFVDAALEVLARAPDGADFLVIGDGPLRSEMEARVDAAGKRERIRMLGAQPHARAYQCMGASDIYVSVNLFGNISNANLEALAAGTCLVVPTSDPGIPLDTVTDRLIPTGAACRYDRNALPQSLAATLIELLDRPEEIARRRNASRALAGQLIKPWSAVVANDIAHIKSIASRRPAADYADATIERSGYVDR